MKTIYKYFIHPYDGNTLTLPKDWKFLHFDYQSTDTAAWFEIDSNIETEKVEFRIVGTGHKIPEGFIHLGTAVGSVYVWHLYYKSSSPEVVQT